MKKLAIIIALVLGMNTLTFAQGGLFKRGDEPDQQLNGGREGSEMPLLPTQHNQGGNHDADAPLGSGTIVLLGLGAGYAVVRRKRSE